MQLGSLAESLDFDALFASISASNLTRASETEGSPTEGSPTEGSPTEGRKAEGRKAEGRKAEGRKAEGSPTEGSQTEGSPTEGSYTEEETQSPFDRFVDAADAAFEVAFADFVERTSEQTHRTLELAVALLSSIAPERGAGARERVDLANAVKNASVILFGPITQTQACDQAA